jgi:hypothetical protein
MYHRVYLSRNLEENIESGMDWNCSQAMRFGVRVAGQDFSIGFRSRMSRTGP